jgi:hypothetical protein
MGKPSKSIEWKEHTDLKIKVKPTDEVITLSTNQVAVAPINRRRYEHLKATVILGKHTVHNGFIDVMEVVRVWSCVIDARGAVSSIGLPETNVTVIVHGANASES